MVALLCELHLKNCVKFLLWKCSPHHFYGFQTGETLKTFITAASYVNTVHLVMCFRPIQSPFLTVLVLC